MEYEWYEQLPNGCPPIDALPVEGVYYRIAEGNPAIDSDFYSQRKLAPNKVFANVDECIAHALSVFDNEIQAANRLKLPKFRKSKIAILELKAKEGKIKKTFGPNHFSWWRSKEFYPSVAKCLQL